MMEALKQSMLRTELWLAITVLLGIPAVIIFALPKSRIRQVLLHWFMLLEGLRQRRRDHLGIPGR